MIKSCLILTGLVTFSLISGSSPRGSGIGAGDGNVGYKASLLKLELAVHHNDIDTVKSTDPRIIAKAILEEQYSNPLYAAILLGVIPALGNIDTVKAIVEATPGLPVHRPIIGLLDEPLHNMSAEYVKTLKELLVGRLVGVGAGGSSAGAGAGAGAGSAGR